MKKFHVTVTRTDEYIIEVDENIYNEEWKEAFGNFFWPIEHLKSIAEHLAIHQARNRNYSFIEGYGDVTRNGKLPLSNDYDEKGDLLPEDKRRKPSPGLNIVIIDEDNEFETEVEEITEPATPQKQEL